MAFGTRLTVLCLALAAAGGGALASHAETEAADESEREAPPSRRVESPTPPRLGCDGLAFRPRALKRPRGYERRETALARALRKFLRDHAREVGQPRRGWFLLARTNRTAEVAAGRGPTYWHMAFDRASKDRPWRWYNSGSCSPRWRHDRLDAVPWHRDSRGAMPPETTRIPVYLYEESCHGFSASSKRVRRPLVHYGRRNVSVAYFIEPLGGGTQTCPGTPPARVTLALDEPLGDRDLDDAGVYPPRQRYRAP